MTIHPSIQSLIERFQRKEIHAAHSGRELMTGLVQLISEGGFTSWEEVDREMAAVQDQLLPMMLAYAPPMNVLHRFLSTIEDSKSSGKTIEDLKAVVINLGNEYQAWSQTARAQISTTTSNLIPYGANIFTFTLSETVFTTLQRVWEDGKQFTVSVTESRPNNDGLDTATRLAALGIAVKVSLDACIPDLMINADLMLSGAEAILMDGGAVCKVGTYLAALTARELGVPLFILADTMKFDVTSIYGIEPRFEPLDREVFPEVASDRNITVAGHLFDRTPAGLIRGVVTERGILNPSACIELMRQMPTSKDLLSRLTLRQG